MRTRAIPASGELLPVIGLGTYRSFDVPPARPAYQALPDVLTTLFTGGGSVIDTSPMYGRAEETLGELLPGTKRASPPFIATKVWTEGRDAGIAQMQRSFDLLGVDCVDLMQVHNLVDWRTHLTTLRRWRDDGRLRYIGITHYTSSAYDAVERVMRAEVIDFLQINYSIAEREAEAGLLPLAADRGVAVIANRPLGQGSLLPRLTRRPLPAWAAAIGVTNWSTLALAFVVSHPDITCAIPATANPRHMASNAAAGNVPMLTKAQRREIVASL